MSDDGETTLGERISRLEGELELRDLQARYLDALDSGDLAAVMSFIHDECEVVGPRGTLVGKDAIRRDYEFIFAQSKLRAHSTANVVVRLIGPDEAWMSSRSNATLMRHDGELLGVVSTVAERLIKADTWLIRERRVAPIVSHVLTAAPFDLSGDSREVATVHQP